VKSGRLGTAVGYRDADQDIFGSGLGVFHEDVEIAIAVESAGVEELEFRFGARTLAVLLTQTVIRECSLGILVQALHVGVGGRIVEVEIALLDVLSVVAFLAGQSEESLFEDGVAAVPEGQREADSLMAIANASDAVFVPAVGALSSLLVGEILPGVAVGAVVLTHSAPGALAEIGSPTIPARLPVAVLFDARGFAAHGVV
jgi:hypothetical protein